MSLDEMKSERTKCINLKNAVDKLTSSLNSMASSFKTCATNLNTGLKIDGSGVDVYSFGGFQAYVSENIEPIIEQLNSVSSGLSTKISDLTTSIQKEEERLREIERQREIKENQGFYKGDSGSSDLGTMRYINGSDSGLGR